MKIKIIILMFIGVVLHYYPHSVNASIGNAVVTNRSTKDINFFFTVFGCAGICANKYGSDPVACCGAKVVNAHSSTTVYNGDGGGGGLPFSQNTHLIATYSGPETNNSERTWTYKHNDGWISWTTNNSRITFPDDFDTSSSELGWLLPPTLQQQAIVSIGSLKNLKNISSFNFDIKGHQLYAGTSDKPTTVDASLWQNPSSQLSTLWDNNKIVQITGSYGNIKRTITITPTEHAVTITDIISETSSTKNIDLDSLVTDYIGSPSATNTVQSWGISLSISNENVTVSDLHITRQYISGDTTKTEEYLIQPDKVQQWTSDSKTWQTISNKPTLNKYMH